jgi:hypothetical protein
MSCVIVKKEAVVFASMATSVENNRIRREIAHSKPRDQTRM